MNCYSTVKPVFDDVCFVLLLWPFGLIPKDVWFGFQSGHDYTQFPNLNARLLSYDSYLQLLSTNFCIWSCSVILVFGAVCSWNSDRFVTKQNDV